MKISHFTVTSAVFELVKVVEIDISMSDEDSWINRIELFQDSEQAGRFRCRVWESELFRLTPSFPRDQKNEPADVTYDAILVERGIGQSEIASTLHEPFTAESVEAALEMVIRDLKNYLEAVTGEKAG
jgi:hypothetical protein